MVLVSNIRRVVFLRGICTSGLVLGLLVGLCTTPHCVARILNFCKAAIERCKLWWWVSREILKEGFGVLNLLNEDEGVYEEL